MYKISMKCFDGLGFYEDEPASNPSFASVADAFAAAKALAQDEVDGLNEFAVNGERYEMKLDGETNTISIDCIFPSPNGHHRRKHLTVYSLASEATSEEPKLVEVYGYTQTTAYTHGRTPEMVPPKSAVYCTRTEAGEAAFKKYKAEYEVARDLGLLLPSEEKGLMRKSTFLNALWNGKSIVFKRLNMLVSYDGFRQELELG